MMDKIKIGGIMQSDGRALVKLMSVPDHANVAAMVLQALGVKDISIEFLTESFDKDGIGNLSLVIDKNDLGRAVDILERAKPLIGSGVVSYRPDVAVITIFGPHLREKPRVHGTMFASMAAQGIGSLAISTSISSVSCVVEEQDLETAVRALQEAFDFPFEVKSRPKDY